MKNVSPTYLKHQFLIAMPHMADPNFAQTLTYIVEHTANGAMGLVVNRPQDLNLADILEQLRPDIDPPASCQHVPIYIGGPVQTDRGFVLHPTGPKFQATVDLEGLSLSTSQDVLFAIADGVGPDQSVITLGYAGWEAGQLEAELASNAWLTCPFDADILFNTPSELRLEAAAPADQPGGARLMALRLILGFDYGTKQIGVAVGQVITGQARELCTLKAQNGVPDWNQVEALIKEWKPDAVVVGLPLNMDGTPSEMCLRAEKFARRLNGRYNLPFYTHDERLTTFEAKGERRDRGGQKGSYRDNPVDAIAAALLLQGWLDENTALFES
eukprot:gene17998-21488_t